MKRLAVLGVATSVTVLSGCATTDLPSMSEMLSDVTEQSGRACVRESDIDGYGVLENNVISIDAGDDYYLATVSPECDNLASSGSGQFGDNFGEICGKGSVELSGARDACEIHQVFEFENREEAFAAFNDVMTARERRGEK